ncbi:hypothetical protein FB451DRAFT_1176705 [Mycena latifolia]|nr:hypothetical protein FB451DRAFT_1176705 [Mycena latifolia]
MDVYATVECGNVGDCKAVAREEADLPGKMGKWETAQHLRMNRQGRIDGEHCGQVQPSVQWFEWGEIPKTLELRGAILKWSFPEKLLLRGERGMGMEGNFSSTSTTRILEYPRAGRGSFTPSGTPELTALFGESFLLTEPIAGDQEGYIRTTSFISPSDLTGWLPEDIFEVACWTELVHETPINPFILNALRIRGLWIEKLSTLDQ